MLVLSLHKGCYKPLLEMVAAFPPHPLAVKNSDVWGALSISLSHAPIINIVFCSFLISVSGSWLPSYGEGMQVTGGK